MGCSACRGNELKNATNEIRSDQPQIPVQEMRISSSPKHTILNNIFTILSDHQFQDHEFKKSTCHSLVFHGYFRKWKQNSDKQVTIQGLVSPVNIENLKAANRQLKELKQQQTDSSSIKIDKTMQFQCALKIGEQFPELNLKFLKEESKNFIAFHQGEMVILRSWNLGEQMLNFERMVDYVNHLSQKNPTFKYRLIGIIRGTDDQIPAYEQAIEYNQWGDYPQICIFSDGSENDGNVLSCCLIDGNGKILWKRYENELGFASDVEEVEEELEKYLIQNKKSPEFTQNNFQPQKAINPDNYRQLKKFIKTEIQNQFGQVNFTRQLTFEIQKEVFYKNSQKSEVSFLQPTILINSSNKTLDTIKSMTDIIKEKMTPDLANEIKFVNWDKQLLVNKFNNLINENDLKVIFLQFILQLQIQMEKVTRVSITNQQIIIVSTPWEQSNLLPSYLETSNIEYIKSWLITRDILLPKLQQEMNQQKSIVEKRISEICFNFFRQIPGVTSPMNKQFGKIYYAERRSPPYEDLAQSQSSGQDLIERKQNKILIIYLIDYENEDSVNILKELIKEKETKSVKKNLFTKSLNNIILGHIRAESWTKLFQAFIEHHKIATSIENQIIETWFPIEDKISSLSFLGILGKIYGMQVIISKNLMKFQLEKKDIMIVDKSDKIVYLNSSRRFKSNVSQILDQIERDTLAQNSEKGKIDYSTQWANLKKFIRQTEDLEERCKKIQVCLKDDEDLVLIEQKQQKIWDFQNNQQIPQFSKFYQQPIVRIKGSDELKKQTNTSLLQQVYKFVGQNDFESA